MGYNTTPSRSTSYKVTSVPSKNHKPLPEAIIVPDSEPEGSLLEFEESPLKDKGKNIVRFKKLSPDLSPEPTTPIDSDDNPFILAKPKQDASTGVRNEEGM
jgi:hypothetical protein